MPNDVRALLSSTPGLPPHPHAPRNAAGFGADTYNVDAMRDTLPRPVFERLLATIEKGERLDSKIADEVAHGMKEWAVARGATHFTHWFHPLNGQSAEKHDAFFTLTGDGEPILRFSGSQLIQAEPDASSFPSGGMRSTFEARGYTAWDPTSPAFLVRHERGATLCVPTVFLSWRGETLDQKTPLLRSMEDVNRAACRVLKLLKRPAGRVHTTMGTEQEYFLVDRKHFDARPDLVVAGRTVLGAVPAKGQQMEDHYFGAIPERVVAFMEEVDQAAWALGIPVKTRHNEVAPHQYEIAPIFEDVNRAADHNMLLMEVMRRVASRRGFACLLHEKPFAGVNGSGKHNNWSLATDDGRNLLDPGSDPAGNAQFLLFASAVIQAVHRHGDLLRAGVAHAGNDHRLGANEAPPAIVSVYLGEALSEIFESIAAGKAGDIASKTEVGLGMSRLPQIAKDNTDRNRTSPFAFTGNKFEFRAVGSSQAIQMPNVYVNAAVAESLDDVADRLEKRLKTKQDPMAAALAVAGEVYKEHRAVVFNGDGYTAEWVKDAAKRGLPNLKDTPAALAVLADPVAKGLLVSHKIFLEHEVDARYLIQLETFIRTVEIEASVMLRMVDTGVLPAAFGQQEALARSVAAAQAAGLKSPAQGKLLAEYAAGVDEILARRAALDVALAKAKKGHPPAPEHARAICDDVRPAMAALRAACDAIESKTDAARWPFPTYHQMLFQ
ncbi:MAG: glutamine synthetase III [Planctomycetia bacterium]|nr:glutamine synthetase III [Planctomycetia bacterium]